MDTLSPKCQNVKKNEVNWTGIFLCVLQAVTRLKFAILKKVDKFLNFKNFKLTFRLKLNVIGFVKYPNDLFYNSVLNLNIRFKYLS